jgi:hypothetical protein
LLKLGWTSGRVNSERNKFTRKKYSRFLHYFLKKNEKMKGRFVFQIMLLLRISCLAVSCAKVLPFKKYIWKSPMVRYSVTLWLFHLYFQAQKHLFSYQLYLSVLYLFHLITLIILLLWIILSRVGCVTRQVTSRLIWYSEFIPLALTFTPFTIIQLLPSTVSQLRLLM